MRSRCLAVVLGLTSSACVMESTTTTLQLRDPTKVSLVASAPGQPEQVLPAGGLEATQPLAAGRFSTQLGGSSDYALRATRLKNGAIELDVDTKVALSNGEHQTALPPTGTIDVSTTDFNQLALMNGPTARTFRYAACASLSRTRSAYQFSTQPPCHGDLTVPYVLETSWDNVIEVREHTEPERGLALLAMVLPTISFVLPGAILWAASSSSSVKNDPTPTIGKVFVGIGVGLDLLAFPTLFASESTRTLDLTNRR